MKRLLRRVFADVLHDLDLGNAMGGAVGAQLRAKAADGPLLVIAFGKGARPMAERLLHEVGAARVRGLLVPPAGDTAALPPFEVLPGGHPLPTAGSLDAARRALELARGIGPHEHAVFLVSGGGSAMLELPSDPATTLDELRALYEALVGSGAPIVAMNTVRRRFSAIKGGRLALAAAAAKSQTTLAISDVPDTDWAALASGPTAPEPSDDAACRAVLAHYALDSALPEHTHQLWRRGELPAPLRLDHPLLREATFVAVQDEAAARRAAGRALQATGIAVEVVRDVDDLPYRTAAERLLQRLLRLRRRRPGRTVAVVASGEVAVPLPAAPGVGGRNLQFALHLARRIRGLPIAALSCGTDGVDGVAPAAGAVVDGHTATRVRRHGFDLGTSLARCDAFAALDAIGDTVVTGPTGTNVRDLRILVWRA